MSISPLRPLISTDRIDGVPDATVTATGDFIAGTGPDPIGGEISLVAQTNVVVSTNDGPIEIVADGAAGDIDADADRDINLTATGRDVNIDANGRDVNIAGFNDVNIDANHGRINLGNSPGDGYAMRAPNGTQYLVTVSNAGALTVAPA